MAPKESLDGRKGGVYRNMLLGLIAQEKGGCDFKLTFRSPMSKRQWQETGMYRKENKKKKACGQRLNKGGERGKKRKVEPLNMRTIDQGESEGLQGEATNKRIDKMKKRNVQGQTKPQQKAGGQGSQEVRHRADVQGYNGRGGT